jgi:hypothetical protein
MFLSGATDAVGKAGTAFSRVLLGARAPRNAGRTWKRRKQISKSGCSPFASVMRMPLAKGSVSFRAPARPPVHLTLGQKSIAVFGRLLIKKSVFFNNQNGEQGLL